MKSDALDVGGPEGEGDAHDYSSWKGRVIDERYRVGDLLGEGGMGAVFLAEHLKLNKKVALKVIHPSLAGEGEMAKRFAREATTSARLDHVHVASALDYGALPEGGAYLIMQYVRGRSLRERMDDENEAALHWIEACAIGSQIADALVAAHAAGIVHRDLKPDNVMLEPSSDDGVLVKVLDFGVAHLSESTREKAAVTQLTRVGAILGTPGYMSPEQALGQPIDTSSDLYALGLLLREMITGDGLFANMSLTTIVTIQLTEEAPRLSEDEERWIPTRLDDLVARLLLREHVARPTALETRAELRDLLIAAKLKAIEPDAVPVTSTPRLKTNEGPVPTLIKPAPRAQTRGTSVTVTVPPAVVEAVATARRAVTQLGAEADKAGLSHRWLGLGCSAVGLVALLVFATLVTVVVSDEDTVTEEVTSGAEPAATERNLPREMPIALSPEDPIPGALTDTSTQLLSSSTRRRDRRAAAEEILEYEPASAVPEFVRVAAELELARGCRAKRTHVQRLGELGNKRVLPALERLERSRRDGCGNIFRRQDCYGCLRESLDDTIQALRASP